MFSRPEVCRAASALVLALVAILIATEPTAAYASCNPGRSNNHVSYQAGWAHYNVPYPVEYNSAAIYNYPSPYTVPSTGLSTAWVMLSDVGFYAQVGWLQDHTGRHTVTQWVVTQGQQHGSASLTAATPGTSSWYELGAPLGDSTLCFYLDGNQVGSCAQTILQWSDGQDFGEINSLANQMPGGVNQPERWFNSFLFYNGGQQHDFSGHASGNSNYFNYFAYNTTYANAGDKACVT